MNKCSRVPRSSVREGCSQSGGISRVLDLALDPPTGRVRGGEGRRDLGDGMPSLLPDLTRRGIVDLVETPLELQQYGDYYGGYGLFPPGT